MPFVLMARTDIPDGVLQLTELKPNDSQRNYIYETEGQTQYVKNMPASDTVVTAGGGPITTVGTYAGMAAYLIDNVEDQAAGLPALTAAMANAAAAVIELEAQAGLPLDSAALIVLLVAVGATAGTGVDVNGSTGSVEDILGILAGRDYVLPAGSQVEDGGAAFDATVSGSFTNDGEYKKLYDTSAFKISNGSGQLAGFKAATFNYDGAAGAALTVYADDGTVL
jgi:hypothetical protein